MNESQRKSLISKMVQIFGQMVVLILFICAGCNDQPNHQTELGIWEGILTSSINIDSGHKENNVIDIHPEKKSKSFLIW